MEQSEGAPSADFARPPLPATNATGEAGEPQSLNAEVLPAGSLQTNSVNNSSPPELRHLMLSADKRSPGQATISSSRSAPPGNINRLRFYSWWFEDVESTDLTLRVSCDSVAGGGVARRYVTLDFDVKSQSFTIRSMTEDQELVVPGLLGVTTKAGAMVEVWDLFVGASLDIMGKTVTLLKADIDTATWLEYHAKRLRKLKADLHAELQKYKPRSHPNALVFDRGDKKSSGGLSLRYIVNQINTMLEDLAQYRPGKTEAFRSRIGLQL